MSEIIDIFQRFRTDVCALKIKAHGSKINLHPLKIKLLKAEKKVAITDCGLDDSFITFDKIDNIRNKRNKHKPRSSNKINTKPYINPMLEYSRIM